MRQKQFKRKIACNRRFSDDFYYSVELPAILAGLPVSPAGDGITVYNDSDADDTSYSSLSFFARYNVQNQTLEEAAKEILEYINHPDNDQLSITPASVKGADAAYKISYAGETYLQAIIAKKRMPFTMPIIIAAISI